MEELYNYIEQMNLQFIKEAKDSPNLIEDMAMLEQYLSESYSERIIVELLQNADDAKSSNVKITFSENYIYFANNGRDFDKKDIEAISRSGSSYKKRGESIGYRGVGFKSSTAISDEIYIVSSNLIFSFSKKVCADILNLPVSKVPTIRIPFLIHEEKIDLEAQREINNLKKQNFSTIFIFKTNKHKRILDELEMIDSSYLLFLKHIESFDIETDSHNNELKALRRESEIALSDKNTVATWEVYTKNNIMLAFKKDNGKIIPCLEREAIFHCFLPTLDQMPFLFKVSADFSTDPSRKHLTLDEGTVEIIKMSALFYAELVQEKVFSNAEYLNLSKTILNYSRSSLLFSDNFREEVRKNLYIPLNNGSKERIVNIALFDDIFEPIEIETIKSFSEKIGLVLPEINIDQELLKIYSSKKIEIRDYYNILSTLSYVQQNQYITIAKIYSIIINNNVDFFIDNNNSYFYFKKGIVKLSESKTQETNKEFLAYLESFSISKYLDKFFGMFSINNNLMNINSFSNNISRSMTEVSSNFISKWKTAEEQCVLFEKHLGNSAEAVGKKNLGYDVISKTPDGKNRYIEVKSVEKNGEFTLTNNEYTTAHIYQDDYYICLIYQDDLNLEITYIKNPIKNLELEKRVKAWEWFCDSYIGETYTIKN